MFIRFKKFPQVFVGVGWVLRVWCGVCWLTQLAQEEACNLMEAAACFCISRLISRFSVYS